MIMTLSEKREVKAKRKYFGCWRRFARVCPSRAQAPARMRTLIQTGAELAPSKWFQLCLLYKALHFGRSDNKARVGGDPFRSLQLHSSTSYPRYIPFLPLFILAAFSLYPYFIKIKQQILSHCFVLLIY